MTTSHTKPEWAQSKRDKANAERVAQGLKPKRRIIPWVVLGVVVVGGVAFVATRPEAETPVAVTAPVEVLKQIRNSETAVLAPSVLSQVVKVTGTLIPANQADVAAQVGGRVLSLAVRPGDTVEAGNVIAQLDTENLLIQLTQQRATAEATRAQVMSSEQQLQRTEELARQGLASPSTLDQARAADAALKANMTALENVVKAAELSYANATVRAPISGIVSTRPVEPGQTVGVGTPLLTIVNLETMEYQASASVSASALVEPGQPVQISVSGLEGVTFEGKVTRVNPVAAAGTRSVQIYVTVDNPGQRLRGGMFATGNITVAQKTDAIAVPALALREDADGFYVLKLDGDVLVRQAVEPGQAWNRGMTVELSGVAAGDRVVVVPLAQLAAGERFELIED